MEDTTQTLEQTQRNKIISVFVIRFVCDELPPIVVRDAQELAKAFSPGHLFGESAETYHKDKALGDLFTISMIEMDEQEFENLEKWDGIK